MQTRVLAGAISLTAMVGLTACGGDDSGGVGADGKIELTIGTFTEFGYEDLLKEYEQLNPDIRITHHKTGQGGPYHQQFFTKLAANSGLEDVVAIEEAHIPKVLDKPQLFHDLGEVGPSDVTPDRWLDWKIETATAKDGTWIGYGTDIGPLAMCYRKDLFEAAGLPSDPEAVKALFETWESYFAAGDQYVEATGKPWFDSASQVFNAMQNQLETGYFNEQDQLMMESNTAIRDNWKQVTAAVERGQSAKLVAFGPEWNSGFKQSAFATKTCPSWMLGIIEEQAGPEHAGHWAVTDAFPGGGGNWGGSFLAVPKQSQHPEEAAKLAAWLTAPEQQIKAFQHTGNFPSQVDALDSPELLGTTNEYFGGVNIGELYVAQANKVAEAQYKGPGDGEIQENATSPALQAVEQGKSPEEGWQQAVDTATRIAG
ncbi:ABC transporter substrate-binding protein [Actinophytocola gossypii]|uniref:Carbohydrate ABC transporter substrate-binding protein n=1 Tax=Actinophytocola gossypii TaxID=2812003 RepID=A0ABT2JAL3_9PSEU|nr:ABC transporter substrate-binding protein [Actinophytocola gossypii]MCT2584910.1 carbohydrate ABC transporter substrate-binding protein [Actinophytocola gossypii]